jgi:hypothetical protein
LVAVPKSEIDKILADEKAKRTFKLIPQRRK